MARVAVLAVLLATAAHAADDPHGRVTSLRRGVVYVGLGTIDGVEAGDVLETERGARISVQAVGERQCSGKAEGAVRVREVVTPPARGPAPLRELRPVKDLPPAERPSDDEAGAVVTALAAAPRAPFDAAPRPGASRPANAVSGDLSVLYVGLIDASPEDREALDLHQARLRSRLAVERLAGLPLGYVHDLELRGDFGPGLGSRLGSGSRPWYRARRLELAYSGLLSARGGRLPLTLSGQGGLIDGVEVSSEVGGGVTLGAFGGLAPDLLDDAPSADAAHFGLQAAWSREAGDLWLRADLAASGSTWHGSLDRTAVSLTTSATFGSVLAAFADATMDVYARSTDRPVADLTSVYAGVHVRPLRWLGVDASYDRYREPLTRELEARLPDLATLGDPLQRAWLQVAFDPLPWLTVTPGAGYGFGGDGSDQIVVRARASARDLIPIHTGVRLAWAWNRTPAIDVQVADVSLVQPIGDAAEATLGYELVTSVARRLDERLDEHRVEVTGAGWFARGLRASASAALSLSDVGPVATLVADLGWRF